MERKYKILDKIFLFLFIALPVIISISESISGDTASATYFLLVGIFIKVLSINCGEKR